jgi:hypothetical protein
MVTLEIISEDFEELIENISIGNAFSFVEEYCNELLIDEPNIKEIRKDGDNLVIEMDKTVKFIIRDYNEEDRN